jgi:hypothetical protein
MFHLLLTAILTSAPPAAGATKVIVLSPSEVLLDSGDTCSGSQGKVDLDRAVWLKKDRAIVGTSAGRARVRIDGEDLLIDLPGARGTYFNNMRYEVSGPGEDLDIALRLGRFGGRLGLYWRETFQHHPYRLGVYLIDAEAAVRHDEPLSPLCSGSGGMRVED